MVPVVRIAAGQESCKPVSHRAHVGTDTLDCNPSGVVPARHAASRPTHEARSLHPLRLRPARHARPLPGVRRRAGGAGRAVGCAPVPRRLVILALVGLLGCEQSTAPVRAQPRTIWTHVHTGPIPDYENFYETFDKYPGYAVATYTIDERYDPRRDNE